MMDKFYECDTRSRRAKGKSCEACVSSAEWHALGHTEYYCRKHGVPTVALVDWAADRPLVAWMVK